jgi:hypothetical protein
MPPCMVIVVPQQAGPAGVMHIAVSVPRIACLIDHVKYLEPSDVKPPTDATERRRYRHRGPTLRSLVKLAVRCDSAEQLGQQLKRRYDRQRQRAGLAQADHRRAEAEVDAQLDRLVQD